MIEDRAIVSAPADVARLAGVSVLVVGDVMLDHYLTGDTQRISPEAPVPVVTVTQEARRLGGAGNVARNIAALGGKPELLSVIGDDDPGRILRDLLGREGVNGQLIAEKHRSTTIKTRIIARNQQMLRVDREETKPPGEKSQAALAGLVRDMGPRHAVILVSDYGKGVVSKPLMDAVRGVREASGGRTLVLVDPKVVNAGLYAGMDLLTPNAKEAGEMSGVRAAGREGVLKAGLALFKKLRCKHLCVTLGAEGMAVFEEPGKVLHVPTVARTVFDVTGAGDTVIAVLALALGAGFDLARASILANHAAGIVVGQVGTAVATPQVLREALTRIPAPDIASWLDIS